MVCTHQVKHSSCRPHPGPISAPMAQNNMGSLQCGSHKNFMDLLAHRTTEGKLETPRTPIYFRLKRTYILLAPR